MINEQRVSLMTRMEIYRKHKGRRDERISAYFMGDYLAKQVLLSVIFASAAFLLIAAVYALYNFEDLMLSVYNFSLSGLAGRIAIAYALFLAAYIAVTVIVYTGRYRRTHRRLERYYNALDRLSEYYEREEEL